MNGLTACMNIDRLHERVDRLHEGVMKACMNTLRPGGQGRYGQCSAYAFSCDAYLELRRTLRSPVG